MNPNVNPKFKGAACAVLVMAGLFLAIVGTIGVRDQVITDGESFETLFVGGFACCWGLMLFARDEEDGP